MGHNCAHQSMELEGVLQRLLTPDNQIRKNAEAEYEHLRHFSPLLAVQQLVQVSGSHPLPALRSLSAVLLRSIIVREHETTWAALLPEHKQAVQHFLLEAVCSDQDFSVRRKLCDIVAVIAAREEFPSLHETLSNLSEGDAQHKQLCMFLVDRVAEYAPEVLLPSAKHIFDLATSCVGSGVPELSTAAASAIISLCHETENDKSIYRDAVSALGNVCELLASMLTPAGELYAQDICSGLRQLAQDALGIVNTSREALLTPLLQAIQNTGLEDRTRVVCIDLLVFVCVAKDAVPLSPDSIHTLVTALVYLMTEVEDDERSTQAFFSQADNAEGFGDADDYESEEVCVCAAVNLERVAVRLDPAPVTNTLLQVCGQMISSQTWQQVRAGLFALSVCAEGCQEALAPHLGQIVPRLLPLVHHPHPRVRYSLLHCIGQLATDFRGPPLDGEDEDDVFRFNCVFGSECVRELVQALTDNSHLPRILFVTLGSLSRVLQPNYCPPQILEPYAEGLFQLLDVILENTTLFVQQQALVVLGNASVVVPQAFSPFYDRSSQLCLHILSNAQLQTQTQVSVHNADVGQLKGQALETLALMGKAVGKERFMPDALNLLGEIASAHAHGLDFSDPLSAYMMQTCARIAGVLKEHFAPFLETFLPPLLDRIRAEVAVKVLTEEDIERQGGDVEEEDGEEMVEHYERGVGKLKIVMNTTQMQEKELACRTLYQYILDLGVLMEPFWKDIILSVVPLLQWEYTEGVRMVASWTIPRVFETCVSSLKAQIIVQNVPTPHPPAPAVLAEMMHIAIEGLLNSIESLRGTHDMIVELLSISCDALRECLKLSKELNDVSGAEVISLNTDVITRILVLLRDKAAQSIHRQYVENASTHVREEDATSDEDLLTHICDGLGWMIKLCGSNVLGAWASELDPFILGMLELSNPPDIQSFSLCLLIDLIEYAGPSSVSYMPTVLPYIFKAIQQHPEELGQTCAYGVGALAQYGGTDFDQACEISVNMLTAVLERDSDEDAWLRTRDNACLSMLRLALYRPRRVDAQQLLGSCLQCFPLTNDVYAAQEANALLLREFKRSNNVLLGQDGHNIPEIVRGFFAVLGETQGLEGFAPETWDDQIVRVEDRYMMLHALTEFMQTSSPELVSHCVSYASAKGVSLPTCLE